MAQTDDLKGFYRIGFNYGEGSVDNFIFDNEDYFYEVQFHKLQFYYRIKNGNFKFDLLFQPEYNRARHRLDNKYFVDPEERVEFMRLKTINEYVLNVGFLIRKDILSFVDGYLLLSAGPGYFDKATERMAKGLAFSDNVALGLNFKTFKNFYLDLRADYRHLSNANLSKPNSGYDTFNFEVGVSYNLK